MVSSNAQLILYSLGECYRKLNKKFEDTPLEVSISKIGFIEVLLKSGLTSKKERALYKNLESLEKNKLVSYDNKNLFFTLKGYKLFSKINKDLGPYMDHKSFWNSKANVKRELQARLRKR